MIRPLAMLLLVVPVLLASGCALCCAPYDCHYPYCGGSWVRDNPTHGRVGSVFEPAGSPVDPAAHLASEETPTPAGPTTAEPPQGIITVR